jgi:prolipoprotein diacylglyceryltransferase
VRIDVEHRPPGFEQFGSFHPTFLYESLWNLAVVGVVLLVERRGHLRPGRLFAVYVAGFALGRFFVERMRIDFAHTIAGLRVNEWISVVAFVAAIGFIATGRSGRRPGPSLDDTEQPLAVKE